MFVYANTPSRFGTASVSVTFGGITDTLMPRNTFDALNFVASTRNDTPNGPNESWGITAQEAGEKFFSLDLLAIEFFNADPSQGLSAAFLNSVDNTFIDTLTETSGSGRSKVTTRSVCTNATGQVRINVQNVSGRMITAADPGTMTPIPGPAGLPLFLGGLALLGWVGRKRPTD